MAALRPPLSILQIDECRDDEIIDVLVCSSSQVSQYDTQYRCEMHLTERCYHLSFDIPSGVEGVVGAADLTSAGVR